MDKNLSNLDDHYKLGLSCERRGEHNDAIEHFSKVQETNQMYESAMWRAGFISNTLGFREKTINYWSKIPTHSLLYDDAQRYIHDPAATETIDTQQSFQSQKAVQTDISDPYKITNQSSRLSVILEVEENDLDLVGVNNHTSETIV